MVEPEFPVATVMLEGVRTAEVATGLTVAQVKLELQLLAPDDIVQSSAVILPDITGVEETTTEVLAGALVPLALAQVIV